MLGNRIKSEQQCAKRLSNEDLVCRDCQFVFDDKIKLGNTSTCGKFILKPNNVLLGDECIEYKQKK